MDEQRTVLSTLEACAGAALDGGDIKSLLGKMGFKGDHHDRPVAVLSGGEKARLALAKFMVTPANLLLLDEPTNHLDIPSKEMLEEALAEFPGTVLAVSHDRYFLRRIATRVLELRRGELVDYAGDYAAFLEKNAGAAARAAAKDAAERAVAQSQIVARSHQTKAEKLMEKKAKAQQFNAKAAAKAKAPGGR